MKNIPIKKFSLVFLVIALIVIAFLFSLKASLSHEKIIQVDNPEKQTSSNNETTPPLKQQEEQKQESTKETIENTPKNKEVFEEKVTTPIDTSMDKSNNISIKQRLVSWGFETPNKKRTIDTIIIHSSYDALGKDPYDTDGLINEYKQYGVSPHYLIDRDGKIYQLVKDQNISYHAGKSEVPDGRTNVNDFSIGIEVMNTKEDKYTKQQYSSLQDLLEKLQTDYEIKYILGHDDIAPGRKTDPWNFDWEKIK